MDWFCARPKHCPTLRRIVNRDSPYDSQTGVSIRVLWRCRKTDARCRRLPAPPLAQTVVEGLIWPFFWHWDALLPSVVLIGVGSRRRLTQPTGGVRPNARKMARSAPRPPFGLAEVPVTVGTSRLSCGNAIKREYSRQFGSHMGNPG